MPQLDVINYDNLVAGDVGIVTEQIIIDVSQTILRGDILKKVSGKFQRPLDTIVAADVVSVASENITTGATSTITSIGYKTGQFNSNVMRFGGTSSAEDNYDVLAEKAIYIVKAKKQ